LAQAFAAAEGAEIIEIKEARRPSKLKAYSLGCFAALRGKAWNILPPAADLSAYDRLVLFSPVWAGNPPPATLAFLALLPPDKAVSVKMVSASGSSECEPRVTDAVTAKRCTLEGFENIKG
jgi:hypothetical protein